MKPYIPFPRCLTAGILLLTGLLWGCIKDNRDNCYTSYQLIVKTTESDSVGDGDINNVVLFIFDKEQKFIGSMATGIDQVTTLPYPSNDELYIVAWGNINSGHQSLSAPVPGVLPGDISLKLTMKDETHFNSPDDLFQGARSVQRNTKNSGPDILLIKRKIANVTVVARGLQAYLNTTDEDFTYIVRGTGGTLDLNGVLLGEEVYLNPDATFNPSQEFVTPPFHVLPSQHLVVDLYKADQLILSVDQDAGGNPLVAPEGKKLTITIDFSGNIHITISIDDWEQTEVTGGQ